MTPKERKILKEIVKKQILKETNTPDKFSKLITENYKNWEIGKVMTFKDNPPFKTPKQIREENLTEAPQKGKHVVYYEKGSSGKKVLDVKPNYKSAALAMNKHMNTGKYETVGIQHWESWNKVESPKIKEGKLTEANSSKYIQAHNKMYKAYENFAREVMNLAKTSSKLDGDKVDEKIILKNFKKDVIPFISLMKGWLKGKMRESVNEGKLKEGKFSKEHIHMLKLAYGSLDKMNPSSPTYKKFIKFLEKLPKDQLKQLANADIKFVSMLAKNRMKEGKLTEAKETIFDVAAKVMQDSQMYNYKSRKGMVKVDMQTANLLTKVWKKVSPKMKKHLAGMGEANPAGLVQTLWAAAK